MWTFWRLSSLDLPSWMNRATCRRLVLRLGNSISNSTWPRTCTQKSQLVFCKTRAFSFQSTNRRESIPTCLRVSYLQIWCFLSAYVWPTSTLFSELMISSGLVLMPQVKWLSFHAGYDFGYLVNLLTCQNLPDTESDFFELLKLFCPNIYDVK